MAFMMNLKNKMINTFFMTYFPAPKKEIKETILHKGRKIEVYTDGTAMASGVIFQSLEKAKQAIERIAAAKSSSFPSI